MLTYKQVTQEKLAGLRTVLERHGFTVSGNSGEIRKMGADVVFRYDPDLEVLTLDVRKAPWMISKGRFTQMIDGDIEAHL